MTAFRGGADLPTHPSECPGLAKLGHSSACSSAWVPLIMVVSLPIEGDWKWSAGSPLAAPGTATWRRGDRERRITHFVACSRRLFFLFSPSCELLPLASLWNARSWRDHRIVANDLEAKDCNGLTHDYIATDHHVTTNVASLSNGRVVANFDAIAYHDQCRPDVVRGLY